MYCKNCGIPLESTASFCPNCGAKQDGQTESREAGKSTARSRRMSVRCPGCGSTNVQFVSSTDAKGPSFMKGCCGYAVLGPFGMLCSICGTKSTTREFWVCADCGTKFQQGEYEKVMERKKGKINHLRSTTINLEKKLQETDVPENLDEVHRQAQETKKNQKSNLRNERNRIISSNEKLNQQKMICNAAVVISVIVFGIGWKVMQNSGFGFVLILLAALGAAAAIFYFKEQFEKLTSDSEREYISQLEKQYQEGKRQYDDINQIKKDVDALNKKKSSLHKMQQEVDGMES